MTTIYTIGFTKKTAEQFFGLLAAHKIDVVADIRLRPESQLGGFAKGRDLAYFLRAINHCDYRVMPQFAPTDAILDTYRADKDWAAYEVAFNALLRERDVKSGMERAWWDAKRVCLLCSEHEPDRCHRRLVAEYIAAHWDSVDIVHLL